MLVSRNSALVGSVALAGLLAAPAFAQTSISDLLAAAEANGGSVVFSDKIADGNITEWRDLVLTGPDAEMVVTIPWLREVDLGGGAAEVTIAPQVGVTVSEDGTEVGQVAINNEGLVWRVEGAGADMRHAFSADMVSAQRVSGEILTAMDMSLTDFNGSFAMNTGAMVSGSGDLSVAAARINYAFEVPEASSSTDYVIDGMDVRWNFAGPMADPDTLESFAPYTGQLTMTAGPTSGSAGFGQGAQKMDVTFSGGASVTDVSLLDGVFNYSAEAGEFLYNVSAAGMGFPPVNLSADRMAMRLGAPVAVLDQQETANLLLAFEGLTIGDGLWNMFDPQKSLPRDPMTLVIDLAAQMQWLVEPPKAATAGGMPVDVSRVDVNNITLQVAGAEILANGGADVIMSGPIPAGDGALTVTLNGVFDLAQKLSSLGLLQPEMVMGARGMIGAFATPTGPDNFRSEIVFSPNGMISANGIPLPIR